MYTLRSEIIDKWYLVCSLVSATSLTALVSVCMRSSVVVVVMCADDFLWIGYHQLPDTVSPWYRMTFMCCICTAVGTMSDTRMRSTV